MQHFLSISCRFCFLCTGGIDYGPFPSSEIELITTIDANATETFFGINIREDEIVETPELFSVALRTFQEGFDPFGGNPDAGVLPEPLDQANVIIVDNDCKR